MSQANKVSGNKGEQLAAEYLQAKGYKLLEQNYRYKRAEVDLIMEDRCCLVLVEVKTRKNNAYGFPEEFVSERKIELYQEAAEAYLERMGWEGNLRFDVVAVLLDGDANEIEHFIDAF